MLLADTHFGHRESAGIVVDLFWSHGDPGDRFRAPAGDDLRSEQLRVQRSHLPHRGRELDGDLLQPRQRLAARADQGAVETQRHRARRDGWGADARDERRGKR